MIINADLTNKEEYYRLAQQINDMVSGKPGRKVFTDIVPGQRTDIVRTDKRRDAQEEGFTARIFNDFQDDEVSEETVLDIMEELKPEEFNEIKQEAQIIGRMPSEEEMDMEEEPMIGSFLDMEEEL